jgi:cytoskeletal protein CcmA (bactofilin family)
MKSKDKVVTFLGKRTSFEGKLAFHGTIRIDGRFKGEITKGGNLIVGEEGIIEADMHVSYIIVRGEVHGNITSDQRVDIRAPGKVFGNIQAPTVVIDEGVIFEGKTSMYRAKEEVEENSDPITSDEYHGGPPPSLSGVFGIVLDQNTGNPIRNASVYCKGSEKRETKTNASGYYEQINLKDGNWRLKIKAKGYKPSMAKVILSGRGASERNFELRPKRGNGPS